MNCYDTIYQSPNVVHLNRLEIDSTLNHTKYQDMKSTHLPTTWINMMKGFISYNIHLFVAFDFLKKMRSYDLNISV